MRRLLVVLAAGHLLLAACSKSGVAGASREDDAATLQMMREEIDKLIEDRSCGASPDCAFIAAGSKPCGGPWRYLVYSRPNVDEALLREKIDALNSFEHLYNLTHRIVSDCAVPPVPVPGCVRGACVDTAAAP